MNAKEWIEFLQNEGVHIRLSDVSWIGNSSNGAYLWGSDEILCGPRVNKETVFHELAHWTGNKKRLNRDIVNNWDPATNDLEESIAWEAVKLMVKRFGGATRDYYKYAPRYSSMHSSEVKFFGRQAYEYICQEFGF